MVKFLGMALLVLGMVLAVEGCDRKVTPTSVESYRKAAEQGDAFAQTELGYSYYKGKEVGQDWVEAVKWYRKAAEQGYAKAQNNLGLCYAKGDGVGQDLPEAVQWFRKAAGNGYADAQRNLGSYNRKLWMT